MDEVNAKPQTTSILELIYLIRAKNKGELSFAEWRQQALCWAQAVVTEYEGRQTDTGAVNEDNRSQ